MFVFHAYQDSLFRSECSSRTRFVGGSVCKYVCNTLAPLWSYPWTERSMTLSKTQVVTCHATQLNATKPSPPLPVQNPCDLKNCRIKKLLMLFCYFNLCFIVFISFHKNIQNIMVRYIRSLYMF